MCIVLNYLPTYLLVSIPRVDPGREHWGQVPPIHKKTYNNKNIIKLFKIEVDIYN